MINKYITKLALLLTLLCLQSCDRVAPLPHASPATGSSTAPSTSMATVLGQASRDHTAFATVASGYSFSFPRDHLAHNDFRIEWWYLTANLTTATGEPLGAQWTQFRVALKPALKPELKPASTLTQTSTSAPPQATPWASSQLYFAHSALTSSREHHAAEKWSRHHSEFAGIKASPFEVRLDNWLWQSQGTALFPATLTVDNQDMSYKLILNSQAELQFQGDRGYSVKSHDGQVASYYYSQPFIDITGEISRHGKVEAVSGKGWLDREWSSQFLNKEQQGWDWFALRLDDGSALMLFQLRPAAQAAMASLAQRQDWHANTHATQTNSAFYSARRMYPDGTGRNINSTEHPNGITMEPLEWHNTATGTYPVSWQIRIPSEAIDLKITPLNPNSAMPLSTPYWEGPIEVSGSHRGNGYMELTGYAL